MRVRKCVARCKAFLILFLLFPWLVPGQALAATALVHVGSSQVLRSSHSTDLCSPRLFAMMALLLTLERMGQDEHALSLETRITVPEGMAGLGRRPLKLKAGESLTLGELIKATLLTSATEAPAVLTATLFPSFKDAATELDRRARKLALTQTRFSLPADGNYRAGDPPCGCASLHDAALLAAALLRHDEITRWLGLRGVPFRNGKTILRRDNPLIASLGRQPCEGCRQSGELVLVTGKAADLRLVAAAVGAKAGKQATLALEEGLRDFELARIVEAGQAVGTVEIEGGTVRTLAAVAQESVHLPIRRGRRPEISVALQLPARIRAPVAADQVLGELLVKQGRRLWAVVPLGSAFPVPPASWLHLAQGEPQKPFTNNAAWTGRRADEKHFSLQAR